MTAFGVLFAAFGAGSVASATQLGNSEVAQDCQQGGWESLFRDDGSGFKNTGDCVSYGAQGGGFGNGGTDTSCRETTLWDFRITGEANAENSGTFYSSQDGSCSGEFTASGHYLQGDFSDVFNLCFLFSNASSIGEVVFDPIGEDEYACYPVPVPSWP